VEIMRSDKGSVSQSFRSSWALGLRRRLVRGKEATSWWRWGRTSCANVSILTLARINMKRRKASTEGILAPPPQSLGNCSLTSMECQTNCWCVCGGPLVGEGGWAYGR